MKHFQLTIKTPFADVLNTEVYELVIDTEAGRMSVLPGHADLVGSVLFSKAVVKSEDNTTEYYVKNALLHVGRADNAVELLCLSCDEVSSVDMTSVQNYLDFVREKLENKESLSEYQIKFLEKEKIALEKQTQNVA